MPESVQAAAELGVDISGHVARRLNAGDGRRAPISCCAWRASTATCSHRAPDRDERAFTLKELVRLFETLPAPAAARGPEACRSAIAAAELRRGNRAVPPPATMTSPTLSGSRSRQYRAIAWEIETWTDRLVDAACSARSRTSMSAEVT